MPECIEVELYRQLADRAVGRRIIEVEAPDDWFVKGTATAPEVVDAITGATVGGTRRQGKLLMVDLDEGRPVLGLRFGMTGRLVLDGEAPIAKLEYASGRDDPKWDRFALRFEDGGRLRLADPRRLGGVELDPDDAALGPDAFSITAGRLRAALAGSAAPLKARLLDQRRIAGLGNLLVDETLWRADLDPTRPASSIDRATSERLARRIRSTVDLLYRRGGSHTGDLHDQRHRAGVCPTDGTALGRRTVGGRTTYSCPLHQH